MLTPLHVVTAPVVRHPITDELHPVPREPVEPVRPLVKVPAALMVAALSNTSITAAESRGGDGAGLVRHGLVRGEKDVVELLLRPLNLLRHLPKPRASLVDERLDPAAVAGRA